MAFAKHERASLKHMLFVLLLLLAVLCQLLICHYFFGLNLDQYATSSGIERDENRRRTVPTRNSEVRYSRFTPVAKEGASSAWTLPNTTFTPYISTLVDFFRENRRSCRGVYQRQKENAPRVNVTVRAPGVGVFLSTGNWPTDYVDAWSKRLAGRVLPAGSIELAFSRTDMDDATNRCYFANSSPGGRHAVFNFQDVARWRENETLRSLREDKKRKRGKAAKDRQGWNTPKNETYAAPLPWREREAIPVFRGRMWYNGTQMEEMQDQLERNLTEGAGDSFLTALTSENGYHQRPALVQFSKLHPELLNARLSRRKFGKHPLTDALWRANATNGLFRLLPFDRIPASEYYARYQTHVVMGGAGAAFRTARVLQQGIAVLLQDYPYEEWFAHLLVPYVHYVPLRQNLTDLHEALRWVRNHPAEVLAIARNGQHFYEEYLSYERMDEFYYELLFRLMLCCGLGS